MKNWIWGLWVAVAGAALGGWGAGVPTAPYVAASTLAKNAIVLKKLEIQARTLSPVYQVYPMPPASRYPRPWFEATLHFDTQPAWLDDLEFRCYILLKNRPDAGGAMLLRGETTLMNVYKGKHKVDFFLHPNTLLRYGEVEAVAIVLTHSGQVIGMMSQPASPRRWWEDYQAVPNMVLTRNATPWALINYDDSEQVKESAPGAAR